MKNFELNSPCAWLYADDFNIAGFVFRKAEGVVLPVDSFQLGDIDQSLDELLIDARDTYGCDRVTVPRVTTTGNIDDSEVRENLLYQDIDGSTLSKEIAERLPSFRQARLTRAKALKDGLLDESSYKGRQKLIERLRQVDEAHPPGALLWAYLYGVYDALRPRPLTHSLLPSLREHHKVNELPEMWSKHIVLSWNNTNPFFLLIGITKDRQFFLMDYREPPQTAPLTSEEIQNIVLDLGSQHSIWRVFIPETHLQSVRGFRRRGKAENLEGLMRTVALERPEANKTEEALVTDTLLSQDRLWLGPKCHALYEKLADCHRATGADGNALGFAEHSQDSEVASALLGYLVKLWRA